MYLFYNFTMESSLIVASISSDYPSPVEGGWQIAFVLTPDNTATLTEHVISHRPNLVFINLATAQIRRVTTEEWLTNSPLGSGMPSPLPPQIGTDAPNTLGLWTVSPARRQVFRPDGRDCGLTSSEFSAFQMLLERRHDPVSRMEISKRVLGRAYRAGDRAVDILMHKLRAKLGKSAIVTIRGAGYAFADLPDAGHSAESTGNPPHEAT